MLDSITSPAKRFSVLLGWWLLISFKTGARPVPWVESSRFLGDFRWTLYTKINNRLGFGELDNKVDEWWEHFDICEGRDD